MCDITEQLTTKIVLIGNCQVDNLGGEVEGDDWSEDSTSTSWYIDKAISYDLVKQQDRVLDTIYTNHKGTCYLVYVTYSAGNSFCHHENSQLELVWVFKDKLLAYKARDEILTNYKYNKNFYCLHCFIEIDAGVIQSFRTPWIGHFEELVDVEIIEVEV